jgi:uncharacterized protein YdcH (DUF465 family)
LCDEDNELDEKLAEHCKTIENLNSKKVTNLKIAERLKNQQCNEAKIK